MIKKSNKHYFTSMKRAAKKLGICLKTISAIVRGKRKNNPAKIDRALVDI